MGCSKNKAKLNREKVSFLENKSFAAKLKK